MFRVVPSQIGQRSKSGSIGVSAFTTLMIAAMPKCPICWMALMSAVGVGSTINSYWLQPLAFALLFLSVGALFLGARRRDSYRPFFLGLIAAISIYLSKFKLNYDIGVYLSGLMLLAASIWNAVPVRRVADSSQCRCQRSPPS